MRIYHTLGGQYLIHDREFSIGTIVLHLDNGIEIFCNKSNFYSKEGYGSDNPAANAHVR